MDLWLKGRTVYGKSSGEGGGATLTAEDVKHALGGLGPRPFNFGLAAFLDDAQGWRKTENFMLEDLLWRAAAAGDWIRSRADHERLERMADLMVAEVISARSRHETYSHQDELPEGSAAVKCRKCKGRGAFGDARAVEKWRRYRRLVRRKRLRTGLAPDLGKRPVNAVKSAWAQQRAAHDLILARASFAESEAAAQPCDLCGGDGRMIFTHLHRAQALSLSRSSWHRHWEARYAEALETPRDWESAAIRHVRRRLTERLLDR